jgi:type I restriction enzyme S subunit
MISEYGLNNSSARWIKEKSVLIALAGQGKTRGTVAINHIPLTTNQSIAAIMPDDSIDSDFLFQNLESRYNEIRLLSSADGLRGGLNKQMLSELLIPCTSSIEQQKIGAYFKELDNLITLHQREP